MNALARDFSVETAEWMVLRCSAGRTLALAAALADWGAWTPTWKVSRQFPRSPARRKVTEACIPTFVFMPSRHAHDLPPIPRVPYGFMRHAGGALIRIADTDLEPLRSIADKPLIPARQLPQPGQSVRFAEGPWQGLIATVLECSQRYCSVVLKDFAHSMQVPPCQLHKI